MEPVTEPNTPVQPTATLVERSDSLKRDDLFKEIGRNFGNEELAKRFALQGKSEAELRQALFDAMPSTEATPQSALFNDAATWAA